jgi:hypothetical protein
MERNMVPTYLDGDPRHRGVWKAQGVDTSEQGHQRMDATSLTLGGVTVMTSDACTDADGTDRPAMGAFCGGESYFLDSLETTLSTDEHIGYWEYYIGHKAITQRWAEKFRGQRVLWRCDNTIAIAAMNKGYSGLKSVDDLLPSLGEKLWELQINPAAVHIPGVWNDKADKISRRRLKPATCEYIMRNDKYEEICHLLKERKGIVRPFTHHTLDGYANAENAKCSQYNTEQNPFEEQSLADHDVWLSCDYKQVGKALKHLLDQKGLAPSVRATLAIPNWEDATWLGRLQKHCTLIKCYPKGANIFLTRKTVATIADYQGAKPTPAGPTPWELNIWRLD